MSSSGDLIAVVVLTKIVGEYWVNMRSVKIVRYCTYPHRCTSMHETLQEQIYLQMTVFYPLIPHEEDV